MPSEKQSQVFKSGEPKEGWSGNSDDLVCGHIKVDPNSVNPEPYEYRELRVPEFIDKLERGENYSGK
jgi:hypothetical protein